MKKKNKTLGRGQNKCARKHTKSRIEIEYELDTESIVLVIGSNLGIFFTILLIFFSSIWFDKYWTGYANGKEDMWLFQADNSWKSNHFKIKLIEYAVNGNGQAATHQYLMTASQFSHTQKIYIYSVEFVVLCPNKWYVLFQFVWPIVCRTFTRRYN